MGDLTAKGASGTSEGGGTDPKEPRELHPCCLVSGENIYVGQGFRLRQKIISVISPSSNACKWVVLVKVL